jgi:hypothetical protein
LTRTPQRVFYHLYGWYLDGRQMLMRGEHDHE